jgi:hypothetical protein
LKIVCESKANGVDSASCVFSADGISDNEEFLVTSRPSTEYIIPSSPRSCALLVPCHLAWTNAVANNATVYAEKACCVLSFPGYKDCHCRIFAWELCQWYLNTVKNFAFLFVQSNQVAKIVNDNVQICDFVCKMYKDIDRIRSNSTRDEGAIICNGG